MKSIKLAVMAAAALSFTRAYAFHEGGVAYCDGCHSMHNSQAAGKAGGNSTFMSGGRNSSLAGWNAAGKASTTQFTGNAYLLQGSDDSSTCLNCHAASDTAPSSYHVLTFPFPATGAAPVERTPAGDFAWLTITTSAKASYGATVSNPGERHGHNVVAQDYGLLADTTLTTAPGGTYPASSLSCASCHDPHSRARIEDSTTGVITTSAFGKAVKPIGSSGSYGAASTADEAVGVYRLLGSATYSQLSLQDVGVSFAFATNPPVAVAPSTYNRSESATETRVAYGQGMSEWCANCHTLAHADSPDTSLIHPASNAAKLTMTANDLAGNPSGTTIANIYNAYKKSGDLTNTSATSYTSLVPYEEGTAVIATLATHAVNDGSQTGGPTTGQENVMCLSCHRAHAGGWSSMTRWNNKSEFITVGGAYPGTDATGEGAYGQYSMGYNQAQYQAAMYDRPATNFAYAQRSMCNKCHAKD